MFWRRYNNYCKSILITFLVLILFIIANRSGIKDVKSGVISRTTSEATIKLKASSLPYSTELDSVAVATGKFYVFTPKCKIPYVEPFTEDSINGPLPFSSCKNEPDFFNVLFNTESKQYIIHLDYSVALTFYSNYLEYSCTYREIMPGPDDSYSLLNIPNTLVQDWVVPHHFLGVLLECHENMNLSRVLQRDAFAFVQYPRDRNETTDALRSLTHPSVFLFGIDTMSRINFQRTMRKTASFVTQEGWYEMQGYNKVGDNTLPNLMAILTGRTPRQWKKDTCDVRIPGCFDYINYLWNHYSSAGYMTAYAEDVSEMSTFNYLKQGFKKRPVDFYLRPFLVVVERALKTIKYFDTEYCVGRRLSFSYVYDFALQLIQRFVTESPKPIFGLFWTSSFTHYNYRGGYNLDDHFVNYLKRFQEHGLFEKAIVILLSDHGQRFGLLTELPSGYLEERLPMLHIYLPKWYRKKHPQIAQALKSNRQQLCSNFDLYLGIRQVLEELYPRIKYYNTIDCPHCRSIFRQLPKNRNCMDAGIPQHYCTCEPYIKIPNNSSIQYLTHLIVNRMNKYLKRMYLADDCHHLRLKGIYQIEQKQHFDELGHQIDSPEGYNTYRVKFVTKPNNGQYRATFMFNDDKEHIRISMDGISRLNSYRNESYCVEDPQSKKFCDCVISRKKFFHLLNLKRKNTSISRSAIETTLLTDTDDYDELNDGEQTF